MFPPKGHENITVPGLKSKHKPEKDLIGIDPQTNRLVFLASASDFENELTLPKTLIRKHPHIVFHSHLIDSHIYIIKHWVLKYLKDVGYVSTVKGELLPYVIKKQLSKPPLKKPDTNASEVIKPADDIFSYAVESKLTLAIRDNSTYNDHVGDSKPCYQNDPIRCYAYIAEPQHLGIRVNSLPTYWYITNKVELSKRLEAIQFVIKTFFFKIIENWDTITKGTELKLIDPKADIKSNQVDKNCFVWDLARLNEKTSFKNCVIGSNTEVNS